MNVLLNTDNEIRSGWKLVLFVVVFVIAFYASGLLMVMLYFNTNLPAGQLTDLALSFITMCTSAVVATLFMAGFVDRVGLEVYGIAFHERWLRDLLVGISIAAGMVLLFL